MNWHPDMPGDFKNQIVTGDARELARAIPDESVDLLGQLLAAAPPLERGG